MKKYYITLFVGILLAVVMSILLVTKISNYLYDIEMNKIDEQHSLIQHEIEHFIKDNEAFIKMVSEYSDVKEVLRNQDLSSLESCKTFFYHLVKSNETIMQIRVLDNSGMERVRVDRLITHEIVEVPDEGLQNKSERDYFMKFSKLNQNVVGVSSLDPNEENAKVEVPWRPTLRMGIPVFSDGKRVGVVAVNYNMKHLLDDMVKNTLNNFYLIDAEGYFIIHPDDKWKWSKYLVPSKKIDQYFRKIKHETIDFTNTKIADNLFSKKLDFFNDELMTAIYKPKVHINNMLFSKGLQLIIILWIILLLILIPVFKLIIVFIENINKEKDNLKLAQETQREQETMLLQQSKLAAMGEMLSSIAHQWRQPLNSIGLITQDIVSAEKYGELNTDYLQKSRDRIMDQLHLMSDTIDTFRNFTSKTNMLETFNIIDAIEEIRHLYWAQFSDHNIKFEILCRDVDNSFTLCDTQSKEDKEHYIVTSLPSELKQVLLNLISNAKDAIEQIKNPKDLELKISVYLSQKDDEVHIDICDNAGGIDENTVKRIFEPYFTTKEMGTGLGLFIVKSLLQKHLNGDIYCENRENEFDGVTYKGTAFSIVIPKVINA